VRLILVPWSFTGSFALQIYRYYSWSLHKPDVEIRNEATEFERSAAFKEILEHVRRDRGVPPGSFQMECTDVM